MALRLHYHPLSSFCWKALIALYETDAPFEKVFVDLSKTEDREAFYKLWPLGKFPVLEDTAREWMVPESSIIIEYLALHHPGHSTLLPADPDRARQIRMRDRFFDNYIHLQMQKIVGDRLRPAGDKDALGVAQAGAQIRAACAMLEGDIGTSWAMGEAFTLADCGAAPALFYADRVMPLAKDFPATAAYLGRLKQRPSFARVLREAEPYSHLFPSQA
ncbi:MAG: glutathione S-transferase family protein [Rhizomicrobium sp.]